MRHTLLIDHQHCDGRLSPSPPPRRSSDLRARSTGACCDRRRRGDAPPATSRACPGARCRRQDTLALLLAAHRRGDGDRRSEEHTSELQSHVKLVCRLLLEKKKTQQILLLL